MSNPRRKKKSGPAKGSRLMPLETTQDPERATVTHSISFDRQIYELMEAARFEPRLPMPRSEYVRLALEEKFRREGRL
jgi:hypothetical protein